MLDDKTKALLGDRAAQERLTAAGVLLTCPKCGGPGEVYEYPGEDWSQPYTAKCRKNDCFWIGKDFPTKKQAIKEWNTRAAILTPDQLAELERLEDGGIDKHSSNPV